MPLVSRTFDQLINFTRTSAGTYVDETGKIASTPASRNLLTFTQEFDNAAWTKSNTTVTANTATAPDGTSTADKLAETATTGVHSAQSGGVSVTSGTAYTYSCYLKAAERSWVAVEMNGTPFACYAYFDIANGVVGSTNGSPSATSITPVGNGWYRCTITKTATSTATAYFTAYAATADGTVSYAGTAGSGIYVWGAQIEQAPTATDYTKNVGGLYPPRFDYDPVTLAPKGLLIEEQRTNLLTYSAQFDNAAWYKSAATVTANTSVSPDGTANADTLTSTGDAALFQNAAGAATTAYTGSVWLRVASGTLTFNIYRTDNGGGYAVQSVTATTAWQRFTLTSTSSGTASTVTFQIGGGGTLTSGSAVQIYGAQLEAGAFATSYIPTVASQVTRTADQTTIDAPNFAPWYNQSEGTFVISMDCPANGVRTEMSVDDGTVNNMFRMRSQVTDPFFIARVGGANVVVLDGGTITANTPYTQANAYAVNNYGVSVNGGAAVTSASGAVPTVSRMTIGWESVGNYVSGHIRSIRYYPTRLSNAQLAVLSA